MAEWSNAPDSKSGEPARVPGVRIPPSPPFSPSEGVKSEARLPVDVGNLDMNHENKFSVSRFRNRNGVFSFRVDGRLNGVRIRRNFKTREEAAAERSTLEHKALGLDSGLRSATTFLTDLAATNSGDYANASGNDHQDQASRNRGCVGLSLTIRTLQRKVPPLHPLSLGNPASAVQIQGTTFETNRVSNATCLAMS